MRVFIGYEFSGRVRQAFRDRGHDAWSCDRLRLKNLPILQPTKLAVERNPRVHREPPSPERWKNRSRTYQGIADAMAQQWGTL